jgi:hypothetical protein
MNFLNEEEYAAKEKELESLPADIRARFGFGLYAGLEQFFIFGVDGTCAQCGSQLPTDPKQWVEEADLYHKELIKDLK